MPMMEMLNFWGLKIEQIYLEIMYKMILVHLKFFKKRRIRSDEVDIMIKIISAILIFI
jgi:hypothetical protein